MTVGTSAIRYPAMAAPMSSSEVWYCGWVCGTLCSSSGVITRSPDDVSVTVAAGQGPCEGGEHTHTQGSKRIGVLGVAQGT